MLLVLYSTNHCTYIFVKRSAMNCRIYSGLRVPDSENFGIMDVQLYVGAKRILDVMECVTQRAMEMTMKDFARYFEVGKGE